MSIAETGQGRLDDLTAQSGGGLETPPGVYGERQRPGSDLEIERGALRARFTCSPGTGALTQPRHRHRTARRFQGSSIIAACRWPAPLEEKQCFVSQNPKSLARLFSSP